MQPAASILICFAVREESQALRKRVHAEPDLAGLDILLTGIGPWNAKSALQQFLRTRRAGLIVSSGFAGALNPELNPGDVIFEAEPESSLSPALRAAGARPGRFHCSEKVIVSAAAKQELRRSTGADAVEMESGIIRAIGRENAIPSLTLRVISDGPNEDLPLDFDRLLAADMKLSYPKLALALLRSPGKIRELILFQKRVRAAGEKLAEVLCQILKRQV